MAKTDPAAQDEARNVATGTLAALDADTGWMPFRPATSIVLTGTFAATVQAEISYDGGVTAVPLPTDALGTGLDMLAPCAVRVDPPEPGMRLRLRVAAYTSGTVNWRVSQG